MSEPAFVSITCRAKDERTVIAIIEDNTDLDCEAETREEVIDGIVELGFLDIANGGRFEVEKLAKQGIQFFGYHGPGDSITESSFASDGKAFVICASVDSGYRPIASIDPDGTPDPSELRSAKKYWRLLAKVEKRFGKKPLAK